MLSTSDVVAFVATTQPAQARAFYEGALGLRLISDDPFAIVFDANGTSLRVTKLRQHTPAPFTVLGWHVADIRATLSWLKTRGVEALRVAGLPQDEVGVWTAPGGARIAWFKDPDGNTLSLTQG
jgi:catechol 2,3-dioxygenase-like lactoylglutathione lyase family enzyme